MFDKNKNKNVIEEKRLIIGFEGIKYCRHLVHVNVQI